MIRDQFVDIAPAPAKAVKARVILAAKEAALGVKAVTTKPSPVVTRPVVTPSPVVTRDDGPKRDRAAYMRARRAAAKAT